MPALTITTAESEQPSTFDVAADQVADYVDLLHDPNEVLALRPRSGGTAYIPVRNITYLHVSDH